MHVPLTETSSPQLAPFCDPKGGPWGPQSGHSLQQRAEYQERAINGTNLEELSDSESEATSVPNIIKVVSKNPRSRKAIHKIEIRK